MKLFFLLLAFLPVGLQAQVITTIAGTGAYGYSGDGGPAAAATFTHPRFVAVDRHGDLFVADESYGVVRKIDTTGNITTYAGSIWAVSPGDGGQATDAQMSVPWGMCVDRYGNLYIADENFCCIRKVDPTGIITTLAGIGATATACGYNGDGVMATSAKLNMPVDVAVDTIGNIYISDWRNYRIRKISTSGIITTIGGNGFGGFSSDGIPATVAEVTPGAIAADKLGNVYFSDTTSRIRKISAAGIISTIAGTGINGYSGDGGPATDAQISDGVSGIDVDDSGYVYISDIYNEVIRKISPGGIITRVVGTTVGFAGDGGDPLFCKLAHPSDIAISSSGKMYIADIGNVRIRCIGCKNDLLVQDVTKHEVACMQVLPNPVVDGQLSLRIHSVTNEKVAIKITNAFGVVIAEIEASTNENVPVRLHALPGIYYIQAITSSSQVFTEKIVVE